MEKKLHVLIIEDLPSDAELAKHQIKKVLQDHIVRVVETEKDFVQTLESFKPDIIVSDYKLPSFDGLSALKIAQKKAPFTPFIILTGSMNEDTAVACMKAGADDYVIKEHIKRLGPAILNAMKKKQIEFERNDAIISLRESEEKFREMANLLPQVVFETDINGFLTFANEQTFKIFGYSQEKIAHGFNVLQAIIPEDRERAKENIHSILYGKNMGSPGYTAIKEDGNKFPILIYSNPIMKNNKPVGMRGIIVDITERMQQEKEYKQLIDGMNDTAFVMNFDGKFVEVNETAVRVLGYTRDELLAMGPADIDPHMSAYDIGKLIMGIKSKSAKKQVFETQHRTKAGKIIPVEISSSPITYHGRFVILSIARDITERKKAQEKLKESEEKFRSITEQISDMIYLTNDKGVIGYVSPAVSTIFGYSPHEMEGRIFMQFLHESDIPRALSHFQKAIVSGLPSMNVELKMKHKDGTIFTGELTGQHYKTKNINGTIGVIRDVTERKQAEERIKKELQENKVLLREVHHRTKNNLQTINSLLQLQQDTIKTKADAIKSFEVSQDRIRTMAQAYEILLGSEYMSDVKLGEYLTLLAGQLKRNYDTYNKVNISFSLDDVQFETEKLSKIGLIVNEILTNALKYAFIGRDKGKISIELKDTKDHIKIKISDDGIGIPKNIDIHNPASLGLSLVDLLLEEFDGTFSVDRKKGTSFTLEIPKERKA